MQSKRLHIQNHDRHHGPIRPGTRWATKYSIHLRSQAGCFRNLPLQWPSSISTPSRILGVWGREYLRSYGRNHEVEMCNNFKDASLQGYTSPELCVECARIGWIFTTILDPQQVKELGEFRFVPRTSVIGGFFIDPNLTLQQIASTLTKEQVDLVLSTSNRTNTAEIPFFLNKHGGCFNGDALCALKDGFKKVKWGREMCFVTEALSSVLWSPKTRICTRGWWRSMEPSSLHITQSRWWKMGTPTWLLSRVMWRCGWMVQSRLGRR